MQLSRMYPDATDSAGNKAGHIRLFVFVLLSAVIFGHMANILHVHAGGWGNPSSSIYGDDLGEEAFKNDADPNDQGSRPNWFVKIICNLLAALGHGIFAMLSFCHANLDRLVFGRVMGGSTSNVAYYTFELQENNPYGAVGSLVYNIIRGVVYVLVAVMFGAKMAAAAWKRGRGASTIAAKEAVKSAAFVILALALMPNVLDLMLYLRDLLLYAIAKGVYSNSYFSGSTSIITAFRDLVTEAENGESAGALILNTIMYDALGVLNVVYVFVYIGVALNMTVLFIMFPVAVLKSMYDRRMFGQWLSIMLACILVPVGDTALLAIPCYMGKNFSSNFGGSSRLALGLVQIGCCMMLLQARNMVKQSIGVSTGIGEGSGIHMGMMAARSAINAGMKGFSKVKNGLKSAKEDDTNAKMVEANAQIDDREMAEHMAKKRADAISGDENPATGNVKDGRLQTEKTVGQGGDFARTDIHTDGAGADSKFTGGTTSMTRSGEMPSAGSSLEEDRGNINAAGAWDMISSIAGADMEKNADDMETKKENEINGEKEYASAVEECINSRNARTRELMDSMEDNPAKLAQELGELESREQEAVRGREMLAAEHEENGKRLEEAENTAAGLEKEQKRIDEEIADTNKKISSLENERESENAGEERKMEIESELGICRKTKEKLEDERDSIEKNIQEAVQDLGAARETYDTSRSKLGELTGITAQKEAVRRRYDNTMDTARDMQGALLERRGELVRANSMNEGRLSGYSEGERQGAWAAVRAEETLQSAKLDYDTAVRKGLPESVISEKREAYQTARRDYSEKKAAAPDTATDICRHISRDNAELARVNSDLGQLSTVMQETDPCYGQMDAGQIQSQISQNKIRANGLQKNINNTRSRMQLLDRGDVEGRSECINMIAQCENAKLDLENQNIVLQSRLNAGKHAASGKEGAGAAYSNMKELDYSDKYMQERRAVASRYANLDNFENPEVSKFLTSKQKAEFYRKRAAVKRTRAVAGAVGAAAGAVTGAGMGMFLGTYGAEMLGEFGGMTGAALVGGAAEAVAGRTSIYKYEAGNLPGNFRTGNSFAGSPQNMTDAQRNANISEICSELKDFSVNQAVTSPNAINSFTRRAEAKLHDLAVEIESRYPGDGQKQQEEFQKQMEPVAREELRSCVIREALSGRHTMINRGYLEKSEVYQDIEDGIMEEYFRVQSLNNINGYLQNGDE